MSATSFFYLCCFYTTLTAGLLCVFAWTENQHSEWHRQALLLSTLHLCCGHWKHSPCIQWLSWHYSEDAPAPVWTTVIGFLEQLLLQTTLFQSYITWALWKLLKSDCLVFPFFTFLHFIFIYLFSPHIVFIWGGELMCIRWNMLFYVCITSRLFIHLKCILLFFSHVWL